MRSKSKREAVCRIDDLEEPLTIICDTSENERGVNFEIVESVLELPEYGNISNN